jgi:phosphoribosylamine--glycine ligase
MLTESGPQVLEFNARFGDPETEVIVPRITSDLAVLLAAGARGDLEKYSPIEVKPEVCVGVVLCAAGYPGTHEKGKPITGVNDAARTPGVEIFHAGTAREGDRLITAGGRVLVVTATASSMADAAGLAYEAADRIDFEGKHMRRDIGAHGLRASRM